MTLEMSAPISTVIPARIKAGATLIFQLSLPDYSAADGWVINFKGQNKDNTFEFSSTASGSNHLINVTAAVTAGWLAGDYLLEAEVVKAAETYTVANIWITVDANLSGPDTGDPRSQARRTLDNINAVLESRATHDVLKSAIEGTVIERMSIAELLMLKDRYEAIVAREDMAAKAAQGKGNGKTTFVRFGQVS